MKKTAKIYIAGHRGLVGRALLRVLVRHGYENLLTASRSELDLTKQGKTHDWLAHQRPDIVIVAAARVGGICANAALPADFIRDNLAIALNLIDGSRRAGVPRLLFLGSSCIYPKHAPQPIAEEALLTGPLEPTNEPYAIAKITGLKLCQAYRQQYGVTYHALMPTNLYGPGDNYHPEHSHVIPGLLRRFHEAKERGDAEVVMWGTGTPRREFLYVDDLAEACHHALQLDDPPDWLNVGTGEDLPIGDLARLVAETVGYSGHITHDPTRPDGTPRKLLLIEKIRATGWQPRIALPQGLRLTYDAFRRELATGSARL